MRKEDIIDTFRHMTRVAFLSISFANKRNLKVNKFRLFMSALFHDIGKYKIKKEILNANRKLTKEEMIYVRSHTFVGAEILKVFKKMSKIIKYHHENYDGSGYFGVEKENIPIESQIIRIIDVYDSLTNKRPYKEAFSPYTAIVIMIQENKNYNPLYLEEFIICIVNDLKIVKIELNKIELLKI